MTEEKKMDQLQAGKMAEALWPEISVIFQKKKIEAINRLKQFYYDQKTDSSLYISQVAVIASIDEMGSDLERRILKSRQIEKEILDGELKSK